MKNVIFLLILFCRLPLQMMAQCYDYYEWGEDSYKKKKYDKAEKYFLKTLSTCSQADIKAASWFYLMDIYKNGMNNDSLYLICKKGLVKNQWESPNYKTVYISIDPDIYIPEIPEIDLYRVSRDLCCELYEMGEYDSALYYFNTYARKTHSKGWCGVGKQNDYIYDNVMFARLSAAVGDTVLAFKWLNLSPYIDPYDLQKAHYLEIFCFYNNVITLYPQYKKGDILADLNNNFHPGRINGKQVHFCTSFRGNSIYFHEEWAPHMLFTKRDTLDIMDSLFHQTLLYKMIEFKDQLQFDSVVTLTGYVSPGTYSTTFFSMGIPFNLVGWNSDELPREDIELTGRFVGEKISKTGWWNYDSKLVAPELYMEKTIQFISYKTK